jgi:hypothetical protein
MVQTTPAGKPPRRETGAARCDASRGPKPQRTGGRRVRSAELAVDPPHRRPLAFFAGLAPWTGFLGFASGSLGCALPANGWSAFQIRATAFLRSENFFTSRLPGQIRLMSGLISGEAGLFALLQRPNRFRASDSASRRKLSCNKYQQWEPPL